MYAVLMKQMLYLKMLAWLEDNIYCNPAIDDLALYMGYSRRFVYDVFYQYGQLPIGQYIRLRRLTHRSGQSALNTTTDRRYCLAVKL